jgi:hypothetical protein
MSRNSVNIVDLYDRIEGMFDRKPDGRKKEELKEWKREINIMIELVNKETKIKIYNIQ